MIQDPTYTTIRVNGQLVLTVRGPDNLKMRAIADFARSVGLDAQSHRCCCLHVESPPPQPGVDSLPCPHYRV
jgi:hypothetical protein